MKLENSKCMVRLIVCYNRHNLAVCILLYAQFLAVVNYIDV